MSLQLTMPMIRMPDYSLRSDVGVALQQIRRCILVQLVGVNRLWIPMLESIQNYQSDEETKKGRSESP